ncbi:MAG TPA: alpha/beta hydrolase [Mycobacteriales bacterium]|nr:alpha/beta hydrolase [Mycobacteriales bacterium]
MQWHLPTADGAGELYVREIGSGETIIALHGGFARGQHTTLLPAVKHLADRFRLVLYDQRGTMRSPVPPEAYSLSGHIADLEQLRTELGLARINLIGHSAGGNIAMAYLDRFPDRVGDLVLLSPSPPTTLPDTEAFQRFVHRPAVERELAACGTAQDARTESLRRRIRFAAANCYHVERWRELPADGVAGPPPRLTDAPENWDYLAALARRTAPVPVILGDHDTVDLTGNRWPEAARLARTVELHIISEAGHFSWIDQPAEFRRVLDRALD